ncbi:MAG: hypothetical protein E3J64_04205 [Anaerolineales bacterium]|nr:MAG: hypothetical protein E3J64_04205 [Anaerolineales bacterium]
MQTLGTARLAPGADHVYVAGEKEYLSEAVVRRKGVPVNAQLLSELQTMRDELAIGGYESDF